MNRYIKSLVISVPLLLSILISCASIDYSQAFIYIPGLIAALAFAIIFFDIKFFSQDISEKTVPIEIDSKTYFFLKIYVLVIAVFCIIDLSIHGVVIFSNEVGKYSQFTTLERRVRHISMLVWTFLPIAFFVKHKIFKLFLIIYPVVCLVAFLDRGRLMLMFVAVALTVFFVKNTVKIKLGKTALALFVVASLALFSILGKFRTGADDRKLLEASYLKTTERPIGRDCVLPESIPFSRLYNEAGIRLKWILAYVAIPIYNLSTQEVCQHTDKNALFRQIVPQWLKEFENKYIVLVSHKQNVATEFLPFYLSLQELGLILALGLVFFSLYFAIKYHMNRKTIFSFLIVLKLLSTSVFLNFAPQFFIWTNFGFVALCFAIDQISTSKLSDKLFKS